MADLTFVSFACSVEDVCEKVHNLCSDTLRVALSNTAFDHMYVMAEGWFA